MAKNRRWIFAAVGAGLLLAGCGGGSGTSSEASAPAATAAASEAAAAPESAAPTGDPLKIGVLTSLTGSAGIYGPPVQKTVELAAKKINDAGGVNGQPIEIVVADDGSDPTTGAKAVDRLLTQDKVNGLVAMTNSAVREAFIKQVSESGVPFVYTSLYEGGSCYPNMFVIGEVPAQYDPVYASMVSDLGMKKTFLLGHDYIWPQKILPAAEKTISGAGGSVTGSELVPFGTTDFGPIIKKIKDSGSDSVLTALVGADYGTFVKQWRQAGLDKSAKIVSLTMTDDFAQALGPDAKDIYAVFGYFSGLDNPMNKAFIDEYMAANPDAFAQNTLTEATYDGVMALAAAANAAGSTDSASVNAAMKGISLPDSPRGPLTIDGTTHHVGANMYLVKADDKGTFSLVKEFPNVSAGAQCSL